MTPPITHDDLTQIREALQYGENYRFGDGDITYLFAEALRHLTALEKHKAEGVDTRLDQAVKDVRMLREALREIASMNNMTSGSIARDALISTAHYDEDKPKPTEDSDSA